MYRRNDEQEGILIMADLHFEIVDFGSADYAQALALREKVLRAPLGLRFSAAEIAEEQNHIQCVGLVEKKVIACAVLVPENKHWKMQRVAVLEELRNQGIGSQLMSFCEREAKKHGVADLYVHARDTAVNFYQRNDYQPQGEYFEEDTIPHLVMRKLL
jgi:predicted GNAT family N-acyltransferase